LLNQQPGKVSVSISGVRQGVELGPQRAIAFRVYETHSAHRWKNRGFWLRLGKRQPTTDLQNFV